MPAPPPHHRTRSALHAAWPHLPLAVSCALLLYYPHPPALDWPQHQAVGAILAALWRQDACVVQHYSFALQPVPYHLLYVLLAPFTWLLGSRWGGACTLVVLCACTHLALGAWARALGRDGRACAVSPLLFFSASFAWGFGPTLAGLPAALMALAQLARAGTALAAAAPGCRALKAAAAAGAWAAVAVAAHGVYLPVLGLSGLPLLILGASRARGLTLLVLFGALATLPAVPLVLRSLLDLWAHGPGSGLPLLTFETPSSGWDHLRLTFAAFDRGLCRMGHQLLLGGSLAAVGWRWRSLDGPRRAVACVAALHVALVWLVPLNIASTPPAWLLGPRFVPLFEGAIVLLALPPGRLPGPAAWAQGICVALFLLGLSQVFGQFDRAAGRVEALRAQLPDGTVLPAGGGPYKFGQAWPPLTRHLLSVLVPHPVCVAGDLFVGGHFPIVYRAQAETLEPTSTYPDAAIMPPLAPAGATP